MFIQRQNNSSIILPHKSMKQNRHYLTLISRTCKQHWTCLYVTVELTILQSQGGVGVEYFHDLCRRSRCACGAKLFRGGADAKSKKWDSAHLWSPEMITTRQDSEFLSRYGYPKTAFKWEAYPYMDIRNVFFFIFRGFRLLEKTVVHCRIIYSVSLNASLPIH